MGEPSRIQPRVQSLREEPHGEAILAKMRTEAEMHRITTPRPLREEDLHEGVLARRFAVEQAKPDGSTKPRPCDDMSESGLNPCLQTVERIQMHGVAHLKACIAKFMMLTGLCPCLWKADIDAAYRRIPVYASHRCLLGVVFMVKGVIWFAQHIACPFGLSGSVYAWDHLGALLRAIAVKVLRIPLFRYCDDFFACEHALSAEHAMSVFSRVVCALLGPGAMSPGKSLLGAELDVLGLFVSTECGRIHVVPSDDKICKWLAIINTAIQSLQLPAWLADKLAGGLSFGVRHQFRRMGRAMIRPIYAQARRSRRSPQVGDRLLMALKWWRVVLMDRTSEATVIGHRPEVFDLFCDARGTPPRLAAVLLGPQGDLQYTDVPPCPGVLDQFVVRDTQIIALELLAVLLGLSTFGVQLAGKYVRVWTDNRVAEFSLIRASSKAVDLNQLVHGIWLFAARRKLGIWIGRVPTHENIADLPSREEYDLLQSMGASWVSPHMDNIAWSVQDWELAGAPEL